jgi:DNA-binding protein WhiA
VSFSSLQKEEIMAHEIKSACCRRAFLQGVCAAKGEISPDKITLTFENEAYCKFVSELIFEIYSKRAEISSPPKGGRCKIVSFYSSAAEKYIKSFKSGEIILSAKCPQCKSFFLKGIFFAAGRVCDPGKQYRLEFSCRDNTERLKVVLGEYGLLPKISEKKNETLIYFKNSSQIEDFFALAGMNATVFIMMDAKINGELRNNTNRVVNCVTNNIDKTVSSSQKVIDLINKLMKRGLLSYLPDELENTAKMRVLHSDLSLSQLAALITPPVSKPGLSHRLKRISELAEELLSSKVDKHKK